MCITYQETISDHFTYLLRGHHYISHSNQVLLYYIIFPVVCKEESTMIVKYVPNTE